MEEKAKLSIVATPIGNLEDVTFRAIRVLQEADLVFAEDTRITKRLFEKYEIETPLESLNARTEKSKIERVIQVLKEGKHIALVTDAGTPAISDPGALLVSAVRGALPEVTVEPVPGPSALTAALSAAGVPASEFLFLGFLPHKKGRETLFREITSSNRTVVFFESPHRIERALASLALHLDDAREVVVAREISKVFEEFVRGGAEEVAEFLRSGKKVRGEMVVIVAPYRRKPMIY